MERIDRWIRCSGSGSLGKKTTKKSNKPHGKQRECFKNNRKTTLTKRKERERERERPPKKVTNHTENKKNNLTFPSGQCVCVCCECMCARVF